MSQPHASAEGTETLADATALKDARAAQITSRTLSQQLWTRDEMQQLPFPDSAMVATTTTGINDKSLNRPDAVQDSHLGQLGFASLAQDAGLRDLLAQTEKAADVSKEGYRPSAAEIDQLRQEAKQNAWGPDAGPLWDRLLDNISRSYPDGISNAEALKELQNIADRINATEKNPDGSPRVSIVAHTDKYGDVHFCATLNHNKAEMQHNINDARNGFSSATVIDMGGFEGTDMSHVG